MLWDKTDDDKLRMGEEDNRIFETRKKDGTQSLSLCLSLCSSIIIYTTKSGRRSHHVCTCLLA
jgi:hypothetical protein